MSNHLKDLVIVMMDNSDFALIPYSPNPDGELKFLFDFFTNLKVDLIMRALEKDFNNPNLENALSVIFHYKGEIPYFNDSLDYSDYGRIKRFLDKNSISKFNSLFEDHQINMILEGKLHNVDSIDMVALLEKDIITYINISIKLKLDNISNVFVKDKSMVFYWVNKHTEKYNQLKKLNQPQFIFNNMNGKLDVNDETLKYFFEICPIDLNVYKELKKSISLETIWKFTNNKLTVDFIMELVETLDDIIFIISIKDISLSTLDSFMKRIETKFPHLYVNFNSLLLMKKDFSQ